jgi:hypothetical protein
LLVLFFRPFARTFAAKTYAFLVLLLLSSSSIAAKVAADSESLGIHGGDGRTRGIHGGDGRTRGIHGGDGRTRGIHGGDGRTRGIHGGDGRTRGIHGGDGRTRGIHGGDGRTRTVVSESSAAVTSLQYIDAGSVSTQLFEVVAMGPIDDIVRDSAVPGIVVLGQFFAVDVSMLSIGDYVLAASTDSVGLNSIVTAINAVYEAGISQVLLRAPVGSYNDDIAVMMLGSVQVDYSLALSSSPDFAPTVGRILEVSGVRPTSESPIVLGVQ